MSPVNYNVFECKAVGFLKTRREWGTGEGEDIEEGEKRERERKGRGWSEFSSTESFLKVKEIN